MLVNYQQIYVEYNFLTTSTPGYGGHLRRLTTISPGMQDKLDDRRVVVDIHDASAGVLGSKLISKHVGSNENHQHTI